MALHAPALPDGLAALYARPLPATRAGPLFAAFPYPTKIAPESIAVLIAAHTRPGDTVLDPFAGSGTTGLAVHLCARPTPAVQALAAGLGAPVTWGPRRAVLYELGALGAFAARTLCDPPDGAAFRRAARDLLAAAGARVGALYAAADPGGRPGTIRHAIWSDILTCGRCGYQVSFWDALVTPAPLALARTFRCPACRREDDAAAVARVTEAYTDPLTGQPAVRRRRVLARLYGQTGSRTWWRPAAAADQALADLAAQQPLPAAVPVAPIPWGDLHRAGYHTGITHVHHFYTPRNLLVMGTLWELAGQAPAPLQDALRLWLLGYNATHATLMTRVVVKTGQKDFVVTGAQSGVLYISSLPVEKNLLAGLQRKAATLADAFAAVRGSGSQVQVVRGSSTRLDLPAQSVDYVFTDPPFGDYIPYAELSFINEAWLGETTCRQEEIVVSRAQGKSVHAYQEQMTRVFRELARTLRDGAPATVVFHSARAEVWHALQAAYGAAGFQVRHASVLDKRQGSFKQVTATVRVQGDPLLLLTRSGTTPAGPGAALVPEAVLADLLARAAAAPDGRERTPERLYARFVSRYLEQGLAVPLDADAFYRQLRPLLEAL